MYDAKFQGGALAPPCPRIAYFVLESETGVHRTRGGGLTTKHLTDLSFGIVEFYLSLS